MKKKMDLTASSDQILILLGNNLREAAAEVAQALEVWEILVGLEASLKHEKEHQNDRPVDKGVVKERIYALEYSCNMRARELKGLYNAIRDKLSPVPEALVVVIQRLDKDYSELFKTHDL